MKKLLLAFGILLALIGIMFIFQNYSKGGKTLSLFKQSSTVIIGSHSFKVTIAASEKEREIGLSQTKSISKDQGMIFLFDGPNYYPFWAKGMKFPIDIIYINNNTIITIKSNVQPPKDNKENPVVYVPLEPADKVLEIQAGLSEKYNFKNGDKVEYENLGN